MPTPAELNQIKTAVQTKEEKKDRRSHRPVILFITAIIAIILIASALTLVTPQTPKVVVTPFLTSNVDNSRLALTSVRFTGQEIQVPEKLFLAQPTTGSIPPQQVINSLINRYQLIQEDPKVQQWKGNGYTLSKNAYLSSYTLTFSEYAEGEVIPLIDKDRALSVAEKVVQELVPGVPFSPIQDSITYVLVGYESAEISEDQATGMHLRFAPKINDIPVFYEKESSAAFIVTVDGSDRVRAINFLPLFDTYQTTQAVSSIILEAALENIKAGKASILQAAYVTEALELKDLRDAELTSVSLEYRRDPLQNIVYPFYRFSGRATTQANLAADVEIITPAIEVTQTRTGR
jgi:hypothetical protein